MGQACMHLPHRMQLVLRWLRASRSLSSTRPDTVLMIGTFAVCCALPIMGPPESSLA